MCTAVTYQTNHFYFGRTLDYESSYGEEIVILPRKFPLFFCIGERLHSTMQSWELLTLQISIRFFMMQSMKKGSAWQG